ncbi:carbohydrate ABC transporter permease [Streptomyces lomondensis]|uniref:Sugar ABC transporter permease n=1 Tax=Streptomyces lomondensis TaxID=68229 RepID=A0ABQ2XIM3_9ACTN|nr:sugar ABC transporter permease [Streptomyces lomondensis]MCF0079650.1 sugar ABC transporter permease [Streptomyces lomondensis]GGX19524.1 sugar ABC transporter permease [Streptomyces lomondensis]
MTTLTAARERPRPVRRTRKTHARRREGLTALGMAAPAVVLLIVFVVVPLALTFALAFTDARLISPTPARFVGLDNFTRLFQDPVFFKSLRNTAYFAAVVVPLQGGLALVLALLVNAKVRGVNFFRTVYFLPVVTSMVVVSLLWTFLYRQDGLVNHVLSALTLGHVEGRDWLGDPATAMPAIILMSVWQGVGFHMIIWLAGLQTIPAELYEAADLDGATRWHRFRHVTWPGLRATRTFVLITITIQALGLFTQINVMTEGGPLDSTTTVVYQAMRTGYEQQQTAYAASISLVFFVLVLAVSLVQRFLTREKD